MDDLQSSHVMLRLLHKDYFCPYLQAFSRQVRARLHVSSLLYEYEYLKERLALQSRGKTHFYCIFLPCDQRVIGAIEIRQADVSRGQLYAWIHEHYWGKGHFQEALYLATTHYFTSTGALFVNAYIDADNKRSYHAFKKYGFMDVSMINGDRGMQYELMLRKQ